MKIITFIFSILVVWKMECRQEEYQIVSLDNLKAPIVFHYPGTCQAWAVNRKSESFIFKASPEIAHQLRPGSIIVLHRTK